MQRIEQLAQAAETASAGIDSLSAEIHTIGDVLEVIKSVAEQTNLLALNACVRWRAAPVNRPRKSSVWWRACAATRSSR